MIFKTEFSTIDQMMKLAGLRNDKSDKPVIRYLTILRHVVQISLSICTVFSCYNLGFKNSLGLLTFFSVIAIITNIQTAFFIYNYDINVLIVCDLKALMKIQELDRTPKLVHDETDFAWKNIQIYSFNMFAFMVGYSTLPILIDSILFIFQIEVPSIVPPLPLQGFLIGTERHSVFYYYICFIGWFWINSGMLCTTGNQSVMYIFLAYYSLGIAVLSEKIKKLSREIDLRSVNYKDTVDEKVAEKEFVSLVQEHKLLLRIYHNIKLYCGFPIALQNISLSACICILMFACYMELNTNINGVLINAFCLIIMFIIAGVPCILGQRVETLSEQLSDVLYGFPWYKQSPRLGNLLKMSLRQANRGIRINYHGSSPPNHNTLINIWNTAYSYFMVLKSSV